MTASSQDLGGPVIDGVDGDALRCTPRQREPPCRSAVSGFLRHRHHTPMAASVNNNFASCDAVPQSLISRTNTDQS
jgi:hypothetical protein